MVTLKAIIKSKKEMTGTSGCFFAGNTNLSSLQSNLFEGNPIAKSFLIDLIPCQGKKANILVLSKLAPFYKFSYKPLVGFIRHFNSLQNGKWSLEPFYLLGKLYNNNKKSI